MNGEQLSHLALTRREPHATRPWLYQFCRLHEVGCPAISKCIILSPLQSHFPHL